MQGSGSEEVPKLAGLGNRLEIGAKWARKIGNLPGLDVVING